MYSSESSSSAPPASSESWQSSRPRPRTSEKPGKRVRDDSDRSIPRIRHQYYDKILNKVDKFVRVATETLKTSSKTSQTSDSSQNEFWDDSADCDEETMAAKHLKCQVGLKLRHFSFLKKFQNFFKNAFYLNLRIHERIDKADFSDVRCILPDLVITKII